MLRDVGWQFVNQMYNFGMNVANSGQTVDINERLGQCGLTVVGSCGGALGARLALQKVMASAMQGASKVGRGSFLLSIVCNQVLPPLTGSVLGNYINMKMSRLQETTDGLAVRSAPHMGGELIGYSPIAGQRAVTETIHSRNLLMAGGMLGMTLLPALFCHDPSAAGGLGCTQNKALDDFVVCCNTAMVVFARGPHARPSRASSPSRIFASISSVFWPCSLRPVLPLSLAPFQSYIEIEAADLEPAFASRATGEEIHRGSTPTVGSSVILGIRIIQVRTL